MNLALPRALSARAKRLTISRHSIGRSTSETCCESFEPRDVQRSFRPTHKPPCERIMTGRVLAATPRSANHTLHQNAAAQLKRAWGTYLQFKESQADEDSPAHADQIDEQHGS